MREIVRVGRVLDQERHSERGDKLMDALGIRDRARAWRHAHPYIRAARVPALRLRAGGLAAYSGVLCGRGDRRRKTSTRFVVTRCQDLQDAHDCWKVPQVLQIGKI